MKYLILDIETAPLAKEAFENSEPFDPALVKTGNRGPGKRAEFLKEAEAEHWKNIVDKACLDPMSSHIRAVGLAWVNDMHEIGDILLLAHTDKFPSSFDPEWLKFYSKEICATDWLTFIDGMHPQFQLVKSEHELLTFVVQRIRDSQVMGHPIMGHYIAQFDIPRICQRCWANNIRPPFSTYSRLEEMPIRDLSEVYKVWRYSKEFVSLSRLQKFFRLPVKTMTGKTFHQEILTNPKGAADYLRSDIESVHEIGKRMFLYQ